MLDIRFCFLLFAKHLVMFRLFNFSLFLALFMSLRPVLAQEIIFQKSYDLGLLTYGKAVVPTPADNGFLVAGAVYRDTTTSWDYFLLKTDVDGDSLWSRIGAAPGDEQLTCIRPHPGGGYVAGGFTYYQTAGEDDAILIRFDDNGEELWRTQLGGSGYDFIQSMEFLPDNALLLLGGESNKITLKKLDAGGSILWEKFYGNNTWNTPGDVELLPDGGFALTGTLQLPASGADLEMLIIRTDSLGNVIWQKIVGSSPDYDEAFAIKAMPDGRLLVAGYRQQPLTNQAVILQFDAAGNRLVDLPIGYALDDYFIDIEALDDQYVFIGGVQSPDPDTNLVYNSNGFFVGVNNDCDTLWSLEVDNHDFQFYNDACRSHDGGVVATGSRRIYWTATDWSDTIGVCLVKINGFPSVPSGATDPFAAQARLYPNPTSGFCTLDLPEGLDADNRIEVFGVAGNLVRTIPVAGGAHSAALDFTGLAPGVYHCFIRSNRQPYAPFSFILVP